MESGHIEDMQLMTKDTHISGSRHFASFLARFKGRPSDLPSRKPCFYTNAVNMWFEVSWPVIVQIYGITIAPTSLSECPGVLNKFSLSFALDASEIQNKLKNKQGADFIFDGPFERITSTPILTRLDEPKRARYTRIFAEQSYASSSLFEFYGKLDGEAKNNVNS